MLEIKESIKNNILSTILINFSKTPKEYYYCTSKEIKTTMIIN